VKTRAYLRAMAHLDELSATDRAFLDLEGNFHGMHVGALLVLAASDLVGADGALDTERLAALVGGGLAATPRFRQKVASVPGLGAAWVDDAGFRIEHHIHRAAVVQPGGDAELFELAGNIFSRPLESDRPLWELWLVEGLSGGRLAIIAKAHHAMVDGVGGVGVLASLVRLAPEDTRAAPIEWHPDPPTRLALVRALAEARVRHLGEFARELRSGVGDGALAKVRDLATGLAGTLRTGLAPATMTALNPSTVSAHRRFVGTRLELDRVRAVRTALGGTVNDVALAVVTAGLRRTLLRLGDDVDAIRSFRALVPVNMRGRTGESGVGNHISLVLAELPIAEPDVLARYAQVKSQIEHLKHSSHEIEGAAFFEKVADLGGPNLVSLTFSIAMRLRAFNVVITNIAGPKVPVYLARSRLEAVYPLVPLFSHQGIGVAIIGYDGALHVGLFADEAVISDLDAVATDVRAAFEELCEAAQTSGAAQS